MRRIGLGCCGAFGRRSQRGRRLLGRGVFHRFHAMRRGLGTMVFLAVAVAVALLGADARSALADAGRGVGITNVTTNQFTHPWQGGWITNVGTAWCIQSGAREPRAVGNVQIDDVPAARGVRQSDRWALAYALWAHGDTTDPLTAAGLATVVRGLSGDEWADVNVPAMAVSHPDVKARAVELYQEAQARAHWLDGPWRIDVDLVWEEETTWTSTIRYTNASGQPIAGHKVDILPGNVVEAERPDVIRHATTDVNGVVVNTWHQAEVGRDILVLSGAWAPAYYSVWAGPDYPSGSNAQNVVTPNGTRFDGGAASRVPKGFGRVLKTTTNQAYQSAVGAVFEVRSVSGVATPPGAIGSGEGGIREVGVGEVGVGEVVGNLTVGANGYTNELDLAPGVYEVVEVSAPAGVRIDATVHQITIAAGEMTTIEVVDGVEPGASLNLVKVDVATGEPVSGAVVHISRDSDGDGSFDEDIGDFTLGVEATNVGYLVAGTYEITEVTPPEGYLIDRSPSKVVTLAWNETTTVTFEDHRIPTLSSFTREVPSGEALNSGLEVATVSSGDITVEVGAAVRDVVVIEGLGPDEEATVHLELFGPFESAANLVDGCVAENLVWSDDFTVTGSGNHPSPAYTPGKPGVYGYVATMQIPEVGEYTGKCGESGETVTVVEKKTETETETGDETPEESGGDTPVDQPRESVRRPGGPTPAVLPRTGTATVLYLAMGVSLVVLGTVVVVVSRRLSGSGNRTGK